MVIKDCRMAYVKILIYNNPDEKSITNGMVMRPIPKIHFDTDGVERYLIIHNYPRIIIGLHSLLYCGVNTDCQL